MNVVVVTPFLRRRLSSDVGRQGPTAEQSIYLHSRPASKEIRSFPNGTTWTRLPMLETGTKLAGHRLSRIPRDTPPPGRQRQRQCGIHRKARIVVE